MSAATACVGVNCPGPGTPHDGIATPHGSGPYRRADLCTACFYDWFVETTRAEDAAKAADAPAAAPAAELDASAGPQKWYPNLNVVLYEKACDVCGVIIHMRKGTTGKVYPADVGAQTRHRCKPG